MIFVLLYIIALLMWVSTCLVCGKAACTWPLTCSLDWDWLGLNIKWGNYTSLWLNYTSLWLNYTSFWLNYTSLWLNYTSLWLNYTSLWLNYTSLWLNYTSFWLNYTSLWLNYTSLWLSHPSSFPAELPRLSGRSIYKEENTDRLTPMDWLMIVLGNSLIWANKRKWISDI